MHRYPRHHGHRHSSRSLAALGFALALSFASVAGASGTPAGVGCDPAAGPFPGDDENGATITSGFCIIPGGNPWTKIIEFDVTNGVEPGDLIPVWEILTALPAAGVPTSVWTDWHEQILDPSLWSWAGGDKVGHIDLPGVGTFDGTVSADGSEIWFEFPGIGPDLLPIQFSIHKYLVYHGDPISSGLLSVRLIEFPTVPEPAVAGLVALGLAAVAVTRRRRT